MSIIAGALQGLGQGLTTASLLGIQSELEQKKQNANRLFQMNLARFQSDLDTEKLTKVAGIEAQAKADDRAETFENQRTLERIKAGNRATDRAADFENQKTLEGMRGDNRATIAQERNKIERDKLNPALNLGTDAKKLINNSVTNSVSADQSSAHQLDLANRIENEAMSAGALASGSELYKKITGNQDAISQLRLEYTRLRNDQVMKFLPPGAASNQDVKFALEGFPSSTANPHQMASFLRGMAKLNQYASATESAKAEWVGAVGHLGKTKTDIQIDHIDVPAGTTFTDFAKQYVADKAQHRSTEQRQQLLNTRGYMKWATPQ